MNNIESRENLVEETLPLGIIIVIAGMPGVGKTLAAENFARQNGLSDPLTIGRLIRIMSHVHEQAVDFNPSKRSPKVDRTYDEMAINTISSHPIDALPLIVESDLGVWQAEEAIKLGLDPNRVITIQLDASETATGIRVLKRKKGISPVAAIDPETATKEEIQAAYQEVASRNKADRENWENVYKGDVGDPYDESRFDVLINTDKHNENGGVFEVSKAIKKAVFAVLAWRSEKSS